MSDTEEAFTQSDNSSETLNPKRKVAKKKTAKKRAAKKATQRLEPQDSGQDSDDFIPESFSASPDDMDDSGSLNRHERFDSEALSDKTDSGMQVRSRDDQIAAEGAGSYPVDGDEGAGNFHQRNRQPGNFQNNKHKKKKKPQQKGFRHPVAGQAHQTLPNKKKKSKRPNTRSGGFAAAKDDTLNPPSFESLVDWDVFKSAESLQGIIDNVCDLANSPISFNELYEASLETLHKIIEERSIVVAGTLNKKKFLRAILDHSRQAKIPIKVKGIVELHASGYGFIVYRCDNYKVRAESTFINRAIIEQYGLQRGHSVEALVSAPKESETCPFVLKIETIMDQAPDAILQMAPFVELVPYYPLERMLMETAVEKPGWDNLSMRIVDLLTPVGLGQRGLIVAPPRTGKTVLLQSIANSIRVNRPDVHLIILLIDERPEEVTDFRRQVEGAEVISSTFDESAESHVHAAEMVIEKSRRMVENGQHVVILLDSITRLARAYNTLMPSSGKILSGGVEAGALQKPKRFFGSARNIEGGGSLTILGTALVETGSKMDEVIFEEFKGTGNMELHLDRELSNKRVFPALSFEKSGTRKEELLYHPDELQKIYGLRRAMKGVPSVEAMEMLITRVKKTKNNAEFLMSMSR